LAFVLIVACSSGGGGNAGSGGSAGSDTSFVVAFDQSGTPSDWVPLANGFSHHVFANNHIAGTAAPKSSLVLVRPAGSAPLDSASPQIKVFLSFGDTTTAPN
jgi:hypothetical protein